MEVESWIDVDGVFQLFHIRGCWGLKAGFQFDQFLLEEGVEIVGYGVLIRRSFTTIFYF